MIKLKNLLKEAGSSTERQETAFIVAVNDAVEKYGGPITLKTSGKAIKKVLKASKYIGRASSGSEPYTDVQIETAVKIYNISMKGPSAPSLAGGGLRGIEAIIPDLATNFLQAALKNHLKRGLKVGDKVPDTFGKLNDKDKKILVIGNASMGGPIDFMYIGPMSVATTYKRGTLTVSGKLIDVSVYAKNHDLYLRLRARRIDQTFDPNAVDTKGRPKIYSKSPSKGDSAGRIVVMDRATSGKLITF